MGKKAKKKGKEGKSEEALPYKVITDLLKGRCLYATKDLAAGSVLFIEEAIIGASWDKDRCDLCGQDHPLSECDQCSSLIPLEALPLIGDFVDQMVRPPLLLPTQLL